MTGTHFEDCCGLTDNLDFEIRIINVDHQLLKDSQVGYYVETPKTKNVGKAHKYRLNRHLPTYEKIIKNLYSF